MVLAAYNGGMADFKFNPLRDMEKDMDRKAPAVPYLRLKSADTYTIRILGEPYSFRRLFVENRGYVVSEPDKVRDDLGLMCHQRYAVNVIDRSDGSIKVLEAPVTVFKQILEAHRAEEAKVVPFVRPWWQRFCAVFASAWVEEKWPTPKPYKDPGSDVGLQIRIRVTGERMYTRYEVDGWRHVLSQDDKNLAEKVYRLDEIFKPKSVAEIKEDIENQRRKDAVLPF